MSWDRRDCWTLLCDGCFDGWTTAAGQPHADSRDAAKAHATAAGRVVTPTRALCRECNELRMCAMAGHQWGRWTSAGPFPDRHGGNPWTGRVRHCVLCAAADWDPPVRRASGGLDQVG